MRTRRGDKMKGCRKNNIVAFAADDGGVSASLRLRVASATLGFTLIELLVVIVIIMILVGIIVAAAKYSITSTARKRAQVEIAAMETALESYKNDNGVYPPSTTSRQTVSGISGAIEIANSGSLYAALAGGPKTYLTFKLNQIRAVSVTETNIIDPFGVPYNYYRP